MIQPNPSFNADLLDRAKNPLLFLSGNAPDKSLAELKPAEREALAKCINSYLEENKDRILVGRNDPMVQAAIYQLRDKCLTIGIKEGRAITIMNEFLKSHRDLNVATMQVILSQVDAKTLGKVRKTSRVLNRLGSHVLVSQHLNAEKKSLESLGIRNSREAITFLNSLGAERLKLTHLDLRGLQINPAELDELLQNLPELRTLIINSGRIDDENIGAALMHLKKLENLQLAGCIRLTASGICSTLPHLPNLRGLDIRDMQLVDAELPLLGPQLTKLTHLSLGNTREKPERTRLTKTGVQILAPFLTELSSLHIQNCSRLRGDALAPLAVLTGLTSLSIENLKITDDSILPMAPALGRLTSLRLFRCGKLSDASLKAVAEALLQEVSKKASAEALPSLRSLELIDCDRITDDSLERLAPALSELTSLTLSDCYQLDRAIYVVASYLHNLQSLNLTGYRKLTNSALQALIPSFAHLQLLNLNDCDKLTDEAFSDPALSLVHLQSLSLRGCNSLTEKAIHAFSLGKLQELSLSSCSWVNDKVIRDLAPGLAHLQKLVLRDCLNLTDTGLCALVPYVTKLRVLDLEDSKISDRSLVALAPVLGEVTELNLAMCNITEAGIRVAAPSLSNLRELTLAFNERLENGALLALAPSLGKLRRLYLVGLLITDEAIIGLVPHLASLEALTLNGCSKLTDRTLRALLPRLENLSALELAACEEMTDASVEDFLSHPHTLKIFTRPN